MQIITTIQIPEGLTQQRDTRQLFRTRILESLRPVYQEIVSDARAHTTNKGVAGSYTVQEHDTGNGVGFGVQNLHPLFLIQEDGSRPHVILPKHTTAKGRPGFLRFTGQGGTVFTHIVHHPGTKGNKMLANAAQSHRPELDQATQAGTYAFALDALGAGGGTR